MQVSDDPRVGTELAGYRIESLLGWGGMSVVYLAEDLRLKRRVALKLLAAGLAEDESFRDRFLRESELAASIDHPNIVPIYEAGTTEDLLFIAMRYVEGRDLRERLQRGRLDPADAIGILAQVASALDAAHARGLVHRDVKPSNVLLDLGARPDGSDHVYLADFGLTKRVSEETGVGDDGHLLGTIDYVAPEQIAGEEIDGRADVYSLGCVLYECLVGQPPFRARLGPRGRVRAPRSGAAGAERRAAGVAGRARRRDRQSAGEGAGAALPELPRARPGGARGRGRRGEPPLVDVASRAAAGRSDLSEVEAELAGKVIDLQLAREQARALAGPVTPARVAAEGICPFKGLASFEPVDADYFFGRERLVAELVARLVGAGFLGIVGPSGSGKSSVLRAGLLPALAGGVLPGSEGWRRLLLRPGERPLEELRRVLVSGAEDPLAEALDALPADARLLLAVDQLEELFTACRSDAERAAFADTLARAAADPDGRAVVVVALRADFYGRFAAYPALAELLGGNHVLVGPMQASELRRAVELPAGRVGLRVEPELADALVDDVEGEPGALPLLSTALLELWQKREDNTLTLAAYRESGGVHGAVARLAEGTYARDPRRAQAARARRSCCAWSARARATRRCAAARRSPSSTSSATRTWPTCSRRWPTAVSSRSARAPSRSPTRRCCANGRACASGSKRTPKAAGFAVTSPRRRPNGTRPAATRASSTAARALPPRSTGAPTTRSTLNELEREFVTESREASEQETKTRPAHEPAPARAARRRRGPARGGRRRRDLRRRPARRGARRGDGPARPAPRRAGARRGGPRPLAPARPPGGRDRRHAADPRLPARRPPARAGGDRDHARRRRRVARRDRRSARTGSTLAVVDFFGRLLFFDARTYEQIGKPLSVAVGQWHRERAYSPDGKTLAFGGERLPFA